MSSTWRLKPGRVRIAYLFRGADTGRYAARILLRGNMADYLRCYVPVGSSFFTVVMAHPTAYHLVVHFWIIPDEGTAMTDNVENLILEHLRAIRSDIGGIKDDVREIKQRLTSLEVAVAGLRRDNSNLYGDVIDQHARYDRLVERVERIERRLNLADG